MTDAPDHLGSGLSPRARRTFLRHSEAGLARDVLLSRNDPGNIFAPIRGRYAPLAKVCRHETISGVRSDPTFLFWHPEDFRRHLRRPGRRRDCHRRRLRGVVAVLVVRGAHDNGNGEMCLHLLATSLKLFAA